MTRTLDQTQSPANLSPMAADMLARLPQVRGRYMPDMPLAEATWFRVGGTADIMFTPADSDDLAVFLAALPADIPVHILGGGSNILVRDGGVRGVVIRLGRGFGDIEPMGDTGLRAGAAVPDVKLARAAADRALSGLEFYRGIPGWIGGAVAMNAGAYGGKTADVLTHVDALDRRGAHHRLSVDELHLSYRHNGYNDFLVYTHACFAAVPGDAAKISAQMEDISDRRQTSQPVKSRTGGSTFKNPGGADPDGVKAWKLIDAAGCRGLQIGDAQISELHCNFLINHGAATAEELESLGETARRQVLEQSGIDLAWEIRRIGEAANA